MTMKLYVVQGRPQGKSIVFPLGEYVFGRGTECHIQPNSDWVSRQHCLLRVTTEAAFIRDLGSRNGTLVNGTRVTDERRLDVGDHVQIGPLVFEVRVEEDEERTDVWTESSTLRGRPGTEETHVLLTETAKMASLPAALEQGEPEIREAE